MHRHAVNLSRLVPETMLAPLLVLLAGAVLTSQLRRLTVLARRPYLDTRRTTAADITACVCYAALALSHAAWLVYWAVAPGAPFEVFFEACLLAVWLAAEVIATVVFTLCPMLSNPSVFCSACLRDGWRPTSVCYSTQSLCLPAKSVSSAACRCLQTSPARHTCLSCVQELWLCCAMLLPMSPG